MDTYGGNWGHSGSRGLRDAQLVAQAAGASMSTSLICKLTKAAAFPPGWITVFPRGTPPRPLQVSQEDNYVPDRSGFSSPHDNGCFFTR